MTCPTELAAVRMRSRALGRGLAVAGLCIAVAAPAAAQPADISQAIHENDRVVVIEDGARVTSGRVVTVSPSAVTLVAPGRATVTIDASRIGRITERDSVANGLRIGAVSGAIAGGAFGAFLAAALCEGTCNGTPLLIMLVGVMGAGAGAGIGAGVDGLHHRTLFLSDPASPREFVSSLTLGLGGGRTTVTDARGAMSEPLALSGAWTYLSHFGGGVDVSASRSAGEATRPVSCVRVVHTGPLMDPSLLGTCAGSGVDGVGTTFNIAGKGLYAFAHRRVRPYLDGGLVLETRAIREVSPTSSRDGRDVAVYESKYRESGFSWIAGGGAWITLTRGTSLRPAVEAVWGEARPTLRASVGLTWRW